MYEDSFFLTFTNHTWKTAWFWLETNKELENNTEGKVPGQREVYNAEMYAAGSE